MVHYDKVSRGIEQRYEAKTRKRLTPIIPEGSKADGTHKLARFFPECRKSY